MVKVQVEQGWLEGEQIETCVGDFKYYSFKGIPYALPPVGKLRFKAPQPPAPWDGIRSASQHGPNCPQADIFTKTIIPGDEDCLHLNVYTPHLKPAKPLAVMFFVHGGGYQSGSGDVTHYGPDFLVQHDVVLVTINYRLGPLGFLCLDTKEVPGNAGLKDQVAALRWVQQNIKNFGGDPRNVTVFGESAGGASSALHVLSPMSKGLFKRAVPMSGVPSCDWSLAYEPVKRAFQLGKELGFKSNDPDKLLEFLQSLPSDVFINTCPYVLTNEALVNNLAKFYPYTPVIEKSLGQEPFLGESLDQIFKKGSINDVDILIGYTSCEAAIVLPEIEKNILNTYDNYNELFISKKIINERNPTYCHKIGKNIMKHYFGKESIDVDSVPAFLKYLNENIMTFHVQNFLDNLAKLGNGNKYLYKFSCYSKRNIYGQFGEKYGIKGASHLDDLVYLFDPKYASLQMDKSCREFKLVNLACSLFTNFAKYGNPTPDNSFGATWSVYDSVNKAYGDIGDQLTVGTNMDAAAVNYWRSIYDDAGVDPLKLFY